LYLGRGNKRGLKRLKLTDLECACVFEEPAVGLEVERRIARIEAEIVETRGEVCVAVLQALSFV
jgi:hypothetical protein